MSLHDALHDDCKLSIADSSGIPILNMAMLPEVAETLERRGAPTYIHGMNLRLVCLRRSQPGRQGLAAATKLLAQLSAQLSAPPVRLPEKSV